MDDKFKLSFALKTSNIEFIRATLNSGSGLTYNCKIEHDAATPILEALFAMGFKPSDNLLNFAIMKYDDEKVKLLLLNNAQWKPLSTRLAKHGLFAEELGFHEKLDKIYPCWRNC